MKRENQIPQTRRPSFAKFEFVEWRGRPSHESFFPIAGDPINGIEQAVEAKVWGDVDTATFRLVTPSGEEIGPLDLRRHPQQSDLNDSYWGPFVPPDQPFQVAVSGLDWDGTPYDITFHKVFQTKTVAFTKVQRSRFNYDQGKEFVRAEVTNYGPAGTFTIKVTDNQGFITRAEPTVMTLGTGETKKMQVDLWIPADTPKFAEVIVTFVVTDSRNPEATNTAKARALVEIQ